MLRPSELEPVAAGDPKSGLGAGAPWGEAVPGCARTDPEEWLLELGAAARLAAFRSQRQASQRGRMGVWSSRRAAARARRRFVSELLFESALPAPLPVEEERPETAPVVPASVALPMAPVVAMLDPQSGNALSDRIAAYTLSSS